MAEKFTKKPILTERFDEAMQMALEHHRGHLRKDTTVPYVSHLLAVVAIVLELGGDEDAAIAALLHDAVEDGGGPMMQARIDWRFGGTVGEIVAANSDTDEEPKPSWRERKRRYVAEIPKKSQGAILVSLADKLHNARAINADLALRGDRLWKRFNAEAHQVCGYYVALARAFATVYEDPPATLAVSELDALASEMCRHAGVDPDAAAGEVTREDTPDSTVGHDRE